MKKSIAIIISLILIMAIVLPASAFSSIAVKGIQLDKSKITLNVGQTSNLKVTLTPKNTTQKGLTFVTGNQKIATVDAKGNIKGVSKGTTTITVYTFNKKIFAKCNVIVLQNDPKTLTVGIASVGRVENPPGSGEYADDCWATDYIKEKFGKPNNINIKFQLIEDTNDSSIQNYQLMMAAKKAPDLFYMTVGNIATVSNMAMNGALADLKPSIDKYGANIKKFLGEDFINTYGTFYDNLVTVPGQEPIPAISHYWIRQDWLDALGLKMPTTFDEWYSTMKAFKQRAAELQKAGCVKDAKDVIPYAMYHVRYFTDWERIVSRFYPTKYFDAKNMDYYINSGYGIEYKKEGFKEGMQFMNSMYKDGLISQSFALDLIPSSTATIAFLSLSFSFDASIVPSCL